MPPKKIAVAQAGDVPFDAVVTIKVQRCSLNIGSTRKRSSIVVVALFPYTDSMHSLGMAERAICKPREIYRRLRPSSINAIICENAAKLVQRLKA